MYSEQTLHEIRDRLGIVELVGEYVQLKKSGAGFMGLCPFHKEKSPSFHVHPLKQCFHCFGCHKGGNIFTFYCALEGLNFPEAVQRLAKRTGVTLEESRPHREAAKPAQDTANQRLLAAQEWAAKYFHYLLMEVPEYRFAKQYLQSRGLGEKAIKKFRLGVAPKGWNTLLGLMLKRKFTFEELVQAGLVIPKEGSPTLGYDRFRERLMFPITSPEGATIGFGARQLGSEPNQPKYINSPESPLFSKRKVLYGLCENQRGIRLRGEGIVVEGYMDVIGLHESGVENAVATMGTALTEEHCTLLKRLTRRVVTVFDPDSAGVEAWRRSVHLFLGAGIFAKDLSLPEGKDPDEFAIAEGADKFYLLCDKAPRQVTKRLKEIAAKGPLGEQETSELLEQLTPILSASRRLPDRALLWDDLSLLLKVSLGALKEIAEGAARSSAQTRKPAVTLPAVKPSPKRVPLNAIDLEFFEACIQWPDEFFKLPKERWQGAIREPRIAQWLEKFSAAADVSKIEGVLAELIQSETEEAILSAASAGFFREDRARGGSELFPAIAERIYTRKREMEIRSLSAQVRLTQRLGDDGEQLRLLARLRELRSP